MGRDRKNEGRTDQFTKWILNHHTMPAWKALSFPAREVYFHLRVRCFADTAAKKGKVENNNGSIYRSPRKLAEDMGCNVKTAMASLADLQAKGWIVCTHAWERGYDGRGRTALFRLTMMPTTNAEATGEPKRWSEGSDYPVVVYRTHHKKGRKKQTPPPRNGTLANHQLVHCTNEKASSAPTNGTLMHRNHQSSAPLTGAYLLAIHNRLPSTPYNNGRGLCGKGEHHDVSQPSALVVEMKDCA